MPDDIIRVEDLSKKYIIRHETRENYITLRDVIAGKVKALGRLVFTKKDEPRRDPSREAFWALKEVSFKVRSGEVIGIIGRNGAGKTTLLKILSRITEPTSGRFHIKGRVASLLEVGTGFHPELTGRENIFLNGAILGMKKSEIKRKFDEIVDFSEIEKFLDTPVKRYSSGMYVRLAFAVAAHLEPEILLVDEVLAVGDTAFQKKCLGKMKNVASEGRTVLFVSHNMSAINNLCSRGIWIDGGRLVLEGKTNQVTQAYLGHNVSDQAEIFFEKDMEKPAQINSISLMNPSGERTNVFEISRSIRIEIAYDVQQRIQNHRVGVIIKTFTGDIIFISHNSDFSKTSMSISPGVYTVGLTIPGHLLNSGGYSVSCYLGEPDVRRLDTRENVIRFDVTGNPYRSKEVRKGLLAFPFEWDKDKRSVHSHRS
ncbi:ABC transporter ATP-binding protein [Thermodesulfobacteriota bacterium]